VRSQGWPPPSVSSAWIVTRSLGVRPVARMATSSSIIARVGTTSRDCAPAMCASAPQITNGSSFMECIRALTQILQNIRGSIAKLEFKS
jgi:hypothetical protein